MDKKENKKSKKLSEWRATAICGNDITSSCLYVSSLALLWAGPWAVLSLSGVVVVLALFRGIYSEVVGALPLNGGAYNALLNTTSKFRASMAACLTILSYLATAVISGSEAVHYGTSAITMLTGIHYSSLSIFLLTAGLMAIFALLTIRGIQESSTVALGIFIFHLSTLTLLLIVGIVWVLPQYLGDTPHWANIVSSNFDFSSRSPMSDGSWVKLLVLGFCVSLLGISGFESSSNFVEEQAPGVFKKTLRNMWYSVSFFNISICILALLVIPVSDVPNYKATLLSRIGEVTGGSWLSLLVSIDAAFVLCGAVLTSFVGVTGLVHRMALDRCLPQLLLKKGRFNTFYIIIFLFFLLSTLLLYSSSLSHDGSIDIHDAINALAGVYTISFLSVMFLFTVGNGLLKIYRDSLPRDTRVSWFSIVFAGFSVLVGVIGNIVLNPEYFKIFLLYFIPTILVVSIMLTRATLLTIAIYVVRGISRKISRLTKKVTYELECKLDEINSQTVVFFTRGDNIANLNQAMLYVQDNEHTNRIKVVTLVRSEGDVPNSLKKDLEFLDKAYPDLDIELVVRKDNFSPETLKNLSKEWNIPLNFMFIGAPGLKFSFPLSDLGGVRLVI